MDVDTKLKNRRRLLIAALGAAMGMAVFFWLYGTAPLNVSWDDWIFYSYEDLDVQQHYAGWMLFRISNWKLPLGMADAIASPDGSIISYTDSLPWMSIILKLFRGILPQTFQWFGWYVLGCFALQGAAGALLVCRAPLHREAPLWVLCLTAVGSGLLFAFTPALWDRAFRHVALASHYIFLFALYFYLEYRTALRRGYARFPWQFMALAAWAVGIHPYFLPLVAICSLLAAVDQLRITRRWQGAAVQFGGTLAAAYLAGKLTGAISKGSPMSRDGYGFYSLNLAAPFNPNPIAGYTWSRFLPVLPYQEGQYDGFVYLGLGCLFLVVLALAAALYTVLRRREDAKAWWRRNGWTFAACVFLTLFAASNKIYFCDFHISYPLPAKVLELCGIFRASGRMFWLVDACMVVFALYTLHWLCARLPRRSGDAVFCAVLALAVVLQIADLSVAAVQKQARMDPASVQANTVTNVLNHPLTQDLGEGHTYLYTAQREHSIENNRLLGLLAGKQGLITNLSLVPPGNYPNAFQQSEDAGALLASGGFDPDVVYVTSDSGQYAQWQEIFAGNEAVELFQVDWFYFLVPVAEEG